MILSAFGRVVSLERFGLLLVTAAPGVQRLAFIAAISALLPIQAVGLVSADLGIASFLSLLAGGALSNQVMALWAGNPQGGSRERLRRQMLVWQLAVAVGVLPLLWLLRVFGVASSPLAVFAFFAGFSVWQTERAKLLCDRRLTVLMVAEVCLTLAVVAGAVVDAKMALASYGLAMLAVGSIVSLTANRPMLAVGTGLEKVSGRLSYQETGMLALNGVVSTGRDTLMVPAIRWIGGDGLAGLAAQVLTSMAAFLLVPRALTYHYMPMLSKQAFGVASGPTQEAFQRSMSMALGGMTSVLAVGICVAGWLGQDTGQLLVLGLAGGSLIAGQAGMVPVSVLMVRHTVAPIMYSAILTSLVWMVVVLALGKAELPGQTGAVILLLFSVALSLARALYLRMRAGESERGWQARSSAEGASGAVSTPRNGPSVVLIGTEAGTGRGGISTVIGQHEQILRRVLAANEVTHLVSHREGGRAGKVVPALQCVPKIAWIAARARARGGSLFVMAHPGSGFCLLRTAALILVSKCFRAKVAWFFHTPMLEAYLKRRSWRLFYSVVARVADQLCFLTEHGRAHFCGVFGLAAGKSCVIGNPLPACFQSTDVTELQGRPAGSENTILCMSRLVSGKGVDKVIAAMPLLPEYRLLIAGSGEQESRLRAMVEQMGLSGRVEFRGWVVGDEKERMWAECGIFCLPSRCDSFGMSFVEALARGVPVVALDWGGVREVVSDRWNCLLIDDEPNAVAAGIRMVRKFDEDACHRVERRADVERRFTYEKMASAYSALLRRLAGVGE